MSYLAVYSNRGAKSKQAGFPGKQKPKQINVFTFYSCRAIFIHRPAPHQQKKKNFMKRIFLKSSDPTLKKELSVLLPTGYSLVSGKRQPDRGVVLVDLDSEPLGSIRSYVGPYLVVGVTSRYDTELIMETIAGGACEVLNRPLEKAPVRRIFEEITSLVDELDDRIELAHVPPVPTCAIVGHSPNIVDVCKKLARLSQVDVPVLITGDTGTGKELIAESIAQYSERFGKPFVVINCASVPENLLESELFGFEKGAFTGADAPKAGLLRAADTGTLFLDEVGELPLSLQAKLLRFLQTQAFYPIGSTTEVQVDVRVLSATNRNIPAMVRKRSFREDLYHRLCVASIDVPPLKDRKVDIPALIRFFIERYRHTAPRSIKGMTRAFLDQMLRHDWPGNIRELENVVRSAMAVVKTNYFTTHELRELETRPASVRRSRFAEHLGASAIDFTREAIGRKETRVYQKLRDTVDRAVLDFVLAHTQENQSEAARILGMNRLTLRKKLGMGKSPRGGSGLNS